MSRKMNRKEERELALRGIFQIDFHAEDAELDTSLKIFLSWRDRVTLKMKCQV